MRFARATTAVCAALCLLATSAAADLYLGRIDIAASYGARLPLQGGARPVIGTAPGGNAVGAPLVMGANDMFVEDMHVVTFPSTPPFLSTITHASWGNGAGTLAAGAGPGTTTFCSLRFICPHTHSHAVFVSERAGGIRFGGIQRMLGRGYLQSIMAWTWPPTTSVLIVPGDFLLTAVGGGVAETATDHLTARQWPDGQWTSQGTVIVNGMPWTTGRVHIETDPSGSAHVTLTASGYDTTVSGYRNVQLVSGFVQNYEFDYSWLGSRVSPGIAIMNLRFVPEPGPTVLLTTGLALLPLIQRLRGWGRPGEDVGRSGKETRP